MKLGTLCIIAALGLSPIGISGCCNHDKEDKFIQPLEYRIERHDVDQLFRDHNGYRVYFNNDDGRVIEKKYNEEGESIYNHDLVPFPDIPEKEKFKGMGEDANHVKIFKDLSPGTQGYADVIHYKADRHCFWHGGVSPKMDLYYVEIHLPKDKNLSAGNEVWGGKFPIHDSMKEIK